jgi:hypothetical protein
VPGIFLPTVGSGRGSRAEPTQITALLLKVNRPTFAQARGLRVAFANCPPPDVRSGSLIGETPMRRLRGLIQQHEADQGGDVSQSEQVLIRRAAMLAVQCEMLDAKFASNDGEASRGDLETY